MFEPRPAALWRWLGDALLDRKIPTHGRTLARMAALRNLLELPMTATDAEVEVELERFARAGRRRGVA